MKKYTQHHLAADSSDIEKPLLMITKPDNTVEVHSSQCREDGKKKIVNASSFLQGALILAALLFGSAILFSQAGDQEGEVVNIVVQDARLPSSSMTTPLSSASFEKFGTSDGNTKQAAGATNKDAMLPPSSSSLFMTTPLFSESLEKFGTNDADVIEDGPKLEGTASLIHIPFVPGENEEVITIDDLGKGFKFNTHESEYPMMGHVLAVKDEDRKKELLERTWTNTQILTDFSSMETMYDAKGAVGASYGPFSGKVGFGKLSSMFATSKSISFVYRHYYRSHAVYIDQQVVDLAQPVNELVKDGKYSEIYDMFGTNYIEKLVYGAELDIQFELASDEEMNKDELMVDLKVEGIFSADFFAKYSSNSTTSRFTLVASVIAKGVKMGNSTSPRLTNPSLEDIQAIIDHFNQELEERTAESSKNIVIGFHVAPLKTLLQDPGTKTLILDARISSITQSMGRCLYYYGELNRIHDTFEGFTGAKYRDVFVPWRESMLPLKQKIDKKLTEYFIYRSQSIDAIVNDVTAIPDELSVDLNTQALGLTGSGFTSDNFEYKNVTYPLLNWNGFTIKDTNDDNFVPFYYGKVTCSDFEDHMVVAGPDLVERLPNEIAEKPDRCQPTPAPSPAPTAYYGCRRPKTQIAIAKVCISGNHDSGDYAEYRFFLNKIKVWPHGGNYVSVKENGCLVNHDKYWLEVDTKAEFTIGFWENDYHRWQKYGVHADPTWCDPARNSYKKVHHIYYGGIEIYVDYKA